MNQLACVNRPTLVLLCGLCIQQQLSAQDSPQTQFGQESVQLRWKFAEGQSTYYTHEEERTETQLVFGRSFETSERLLYRYRWDVVFEVPSEMAAIAVSFERVRRESVTPDRTIILDTYVPLSSKSLSPDANRQQDEVFRILQTKFVYLATPSQGIAWPEKIPTHEPLPKEFKTPESTAFFSPEKFTSGDSLSMPDRPVKPGDRWATPIRGLSGLKGVGKYRVLGRTKRLGHECWEIEGTTTYEPSMTARDGVASLKLGPRTSMHYFDAEIGRLVFSEEITPMRMTLDDGRDVESRVHIKRQLAQPPSEESVRVISRDLGDGTTQPFSFRGGSPSNVEKEWVRVMHTGLRLQGTQNLSGTVTVSNLVWTIMLDLSGKKVRSIKLIDVTQDSPILLDYEELMSAAEKPRLLQFGVVEIDSVEAQWFHDDVVTERIIKVVVESNEGETVTLYQPILIQTLALRSTDRIVLPTNSNEKR